MISASSGSSRRIPTVFSGPHRAVSEEGVSTMARIAGHLVDPHRRRLLGLSNIPQACFRLARSAVAGRLTCLDGPCGTGTQHPLRDSWGNEPGGLLGPVRPSQGPEVIRTGCDRTALRPGESRVGTFLLHSMVWKRLSQHVTPGAGPTPIHPFRPSDTIIPTCPMAPVVFDGRKMPDTTERSKRFPISGFLPFVMVCVTVWGAVIGTRTYYTNRGAIRPSLQLLNVRAGDWGSSTPEGDGRTTNWCDVRVWLQNTGGAPAHLASVVTQVQLAKDTTRFRGFEAYGGGIPAGPSYTSPSRYFDSIAFEMLDLSGVAYNSSIKPPKVPDSARLEFGFPLDPHAMISFTLRLFFTTTVPWSAFEDRYVALYQDERQRLDYGPGEAMMTAAFALDFGGDGTVRVPASLCRVVRQEML